MAICVSDARQISRVVSLAIATGASSASQQAIGTGVIGGMITATLAVLFVPVFFVVVMKMVRKRHKPK